MATGPRIVAVVGPTGTGKSELAQQLAERLGGVVLSADALQVYRELQIGTAKVPPEARRVAHFGLDLVSVTQAYSAALYQDYARGVIDRCREQGQAVVVCGGTGLYVRAALDDFEFPAGQQEDNALRAQFETLAAEQGPEALHARLQERDPAAAKLIHPHNVRRVVRALELSEQGQSYAESSAGFKEYKAHYPDVCFVGLTRERSELYSVLDARVDAMLEAGLLGEVRDLSERGLTESLTARQAIGYKELLAYLQGASRYEEAVETIKRNTRRYAKRQLTFFGADPRIRWIEVGPDAVLTTTLADDAWDILEK